MRIALSAPPTLPRPTPQPALAPWRDAIKLSFASPLFDASAIDPTLVGPNSRPEGPPPETPQANPFAGLATRLTTPPSGDIAPAFVLPERPLDIDELVQWSLAIEGRTVDHELGLQVDAMRTRQSERAALADLQQRQKEATTRLGEAMREEFDRLSADHTLGRGVTFDEYRAWRRVTWSEPQQDAEGRWQWNEPTLAEPTPPAPPEALVADKPGQATPTPTVAPSYGLPDGTRALLQQLWTALPPQQKIGAEGFEAWLQQYVGLVTVASVDDVRANLAKVAAYVGTISATTEKEANEASTTLTAEVRAAFKALNDKLAALHTELVTECTDPTQQTRCVENYRTATSALFDKAKEKLDEVPTHYLSATDLETIRTAATECNVNLEGAYGYAVSHTQQELAHTADGQTLYLVPSGLAATLPALSLPPRGTIDPTQGKHGDAYFTTSPTLLGIPLTPAIITVTYVEQREGTAMHVFDDLRMPDATTLTCGSKLYQRDGAERHELPDTKALVDAINVFAADPDLAKKLVASHVLPDLSAQEADAARLAAARQANLESPQRAREGATLGSLDDFATLSSGTTTRLDTLSDLNTSQSLHLQMLMERRAKFFETLSNIIKKVAATRDTFVQNLKG